MGTVPNIFLRVLCQFFFLFINIFLRVLCQFFFLCVLCHLGSLDWYEVDLRVFPASSFVIACVPCLIGGNGVMYKWDVTCAYAERDSFICMT